jgi:hypothetical protein
MYLVVFEKSRVSMRPGIYLRTAVKRLSKWYSFKKLYEERMGRSRRIVFLAGDDESVEALKSLYGAYGYNAVYFEQVDPNRRGAYELLNNIFKFTVIRVLNNTRLKSTARKLIAHGPLLKKEVVEQIAGEFNLDANEVRRARKAISGLTVLALKLYKAKPEAFYALGYPIFPHTGFPAAYIVPLDTGVERFRFKPGSKRGGEVLKSSSELLKYIRDKCSDSETLEELSRCEKAVAQGYHAMWKSFLQRVKRHSDYISFKAEVLLRELKKMGVEIASYEIWRFKVRGVWNPFLRRQLLDLLAKHPELSVKDACKKIGISYATAYRYLRGDKEYEEIMAQRSASYGEPITP